jgi:hypothetical protein
MKEEVERISKEGLLAKSRSANPSLCLEKLRKTVRNLTHDIRYSGEIRESRNVLFPETSSTALGMSGSLDFVKFCFSNLEGK